MRAPHFLCCFPQPVLSLRSGIILGISPVACQFGNHAVCFNKVYKGSKQEKAFRSPESTEYLSFVLFAAFIIRRAGVDETTFLLDLLSVIAWLLVAGSSIFILFRLSDKRVEKSMPSIKHAVAVKKGFGTQILEWVDALLQAACLVLLIQYFVFQLYAIPSESMVPEFMIGDRVVVLKTPSGPKFPLTDVGVPRMRTYNAVI